MRQDIEIDYLVIDVSWLSFRCLNALKSTTREGRPSGHIYGVFKTLKRLYYAYKPKQFVFCYDRHAAWRRELLPEYKATRRGVTIEGPSIEDLPTAWAHTDFDLSQRFADGLWTPGPDVERMTRCIPGVHLASPNSEADDMIAYFAKDNENVAIFSGDRDLWQLVDDARKVHVMTSFRPKGRVRSVDKLITEFDVEDHFGVLPAHVPHLKALLGDESDNITGLTGASRRGKKAALRSVAQNLPEYFDLREPVDYADVVDWLRVPLQEQREKMVKNFQVVDLEYALQYVLSDIEVVEVTEAEQAHLLGVLVEFECESLLGQVKPWMGMVMDPK